MKHISKIAILFFVAGLVSAGCNQTTSNPPPPTPHPIIPITIKAQDSSSVYQTTRDTARGVIGKDINNPALGDTVYETILDTNASYLGSAPNPTLIGKSHVIVSQNRYKSTGKMDTTRLCEDASGNVYRYNYGIETLTSNPYVVAQAGGSIDIGWVLLDNTTANPGNKWLANTATLSLFHGATTATIVDSAIYVGDTTIMIGAKSYPGTKHLIHTVNASAAGGIVNAQTTIDAYFSPQSGMLLDITHSSEMHKPNAAGTATDTLQTPGLYRLMTWHN